MTAIRYTVDASDVLAQEWRENNTADTDNVQYVYGRGVYMPDTHTTVMDDETGRYVFAERYSMEDALAWREEWGNGWLAILAQRDSYKAASDAYRQSTVEERRARRDAERNARNAESLTFRTLRFLGDNARDHSIENSLCENYERFLQNVVRREINNPDVTQEPFSGEEQQQQYASFLQTFYRHATRTRHAVLTTGAESTGFVTGGTVGQSVAATVTDRSAYERTILQSVNVMSYEDATKANAYAIDNGWTQAHRAFESDDATEERSNRRPSDPFDGQTWLNPATGENEVWCDGCNEWHD